MLSDFGLTHGLVTWGCFATLLSVRLSESDLSLTVGDMLLADGNWNGNLFQDKIPLSCLFHIVACYVNRMVDNKSTCYWSGTSSGRFSVSSAYQQLSESMANETGLDWRALWKWRGPERVKSFLWLCFK